MSSLKFRITSACVVLVLSSSSLFGQFPGRRGFPGFSFSGPGFSMEVSPRGTRMRGIPTPSFSPRYRSGFYPPIPVPAPPFPGGDLGRDADPVTGASDPFLRSPYRAMLEARRAMGIELGLIAPAPTYDVPPLDEVERRANELPNQAGVERQAVRALASVESLRRELMRRGSGEAWIDYLQLDKVVSHFDAVSHGEAYSAKVWTSLLEPFEAVSASSQLGWLSQNQDFQNLRTSLRSLASGEQSVLEQGVQGNDNPPLSPPVQNIETPAVGAEDDKTPMEELPLPQPDRDVDPKSPTYRGEV